jgi:hypothetical protein
MSLRTASNREMNKLTENKNVKEKDVKKIVRHVAIIYVLIILFFIMHSTAVSSNVLITDINAPDTIEENNLLAIHVYAVSDNNSTINYSIYKNGVIVSENDTYTEFLEYASSGDYDFSFLIRDNESVEIENMTINVLDKPLTTSIISPSVSIYAVNTINITASTNHQNSECNYNISGTENTTGSLYSIDAAHDLFQKIINLEDGYYNILIKCNDSFDTSSDSTSFQVDSTNNIINGSSYQVLSNNDILLLINTTYPSTCRYDAQDKAYDALGKVFLSIDNIHHDITLSNLADGHYLYYIRCKEFSEKIMNYSEIINFSVDNAPTASISFNKNPPLKAGQYDIKIKFSENVQSVNLQYGYSNDNVLRTLPLTGSGDTYSGYLIIENTGPDRVGYFKISSVDDNNNQGNKIRSGEIFLVDVTKPVDVQSMSVQQDNKGVRLRWYYDGDVYKFNIYRSETAGVDNADLLESIDAKKSNNENSEDYTFEYLDTSVFADTQYYYGVTAVDDAGNEGDLSDEASILTIDGETYDSTLINSQMPETAKPLNKNLRSKVDDIITIIDTAIMDTESSSNKINEIEDPVLLKIINSMKLISSNANALTNLNSLKSQAMSLYDTDINSSELDVKINKLRLDTIKAQSKVVDDIQVVESGTYEQLTQESNILDAVSSLTDNLNLSKEYLDSYIGMNKILQDSVTVRNEMVSFRINYLGKEDYEKFTMIIKNIIIGSNNTSNDTLGNLVFIENIPKSVAKLSEISFDKPVEVIRDDSALNSVKFIITEKQFIFSYTVNDIVDLASIKSTNSIILSKPTFSGDIADNGMTALATYETINLTSLSFLQWIVIIGIVAIIFLSSYYIKLEHPQKRHVPMNKNLKNNVRKIPVGTTGSSSAVTAGGINGINGVNGINGTIINKSSIKSPLINKSAKPQPSKQSKEIITNEQLLLSNVIKCNELINNLHYEKARTIFNLCTSMMKTVEVDDVEELHKMMYYIGIKLQSYRQLHNARRYLYYKNDKALENTIKTLDKMYSDIAYHVGFMHTDIVSQELTYLQFIADSKMQLEKYYIKK